jgi:hypothetical protein
MIPMSLLEFGAKTENLKSRKMATTFMETNQTKTVLGLSSAAASKILTAKKRTET